MRNNHRDKCTTISDYIDGKISRKQASIKLGLSLKTISRLKQKLLQDGESAFIHKNTGKTPVNKTDKELSNKIISLYKDKFENFSYKHFYDYAIENNLINMAVSFSTVKDILMSSKVKSPYCYKTKKQTLHPLRNRRKFFGELIQMDASIHDWFSNGEKVNLHIAIDDATSQIIAAYFCKQETLFGYYNLLEQILTTYGIPACFYTDKRTVFEYKAGIRKANENIQFKRVCQGLGIEIITTSVAQAKGRVERSFKTHQQRLVNEFKHLGINTIDLANDYLKEYIKKHNEKFAFPILLNMNIFKEFNKNIDINKLLTVENTKTILNGHCISANGKYLTPVDNKNKPVLLPLGEKVIILKTFDNKLLIKCNGKYYDYRVIKTPPKDVLRPTPNHPYLQTYGQKIKYQDYRKKC
jgi:hypothetical protein